MAATWVAYARVNFSANISLISLFNGVGSGRVLRLREITLCNDQQAAVTGMLTHIELRRISACSGGSTITPLAHDSNSTALEAEVLCRSASTDTVGVRMRRILWSNDEPLITGNTIDERECLPIYGKLWASGEIGQKPIVLREGEGISARHTGSVAVGFVDVVLLFTDEAT